MYGFGDRVHRLAMGGALARAGRALRVQLETDLGAAPEQIITDLDTRPLAVASMALPSHPGPCDGESDRRRQHRCPDTVSIARKLMDKSR
jgi:hypothetical protein